MKRIHLTSKGHFTFLSTNKKNIKCTKHHFVTPNSYLLCIFHGRNTLKTFLRLVSYGLADHKPPSPILSGYLFFSIRFIVLSDVLGQAQSPLKPGPSQPSCGLQSGLGWACME